MTREVGNRSPPGDGNGSLLDLIDGGALPRTPPQPCPYLPGQVARYRAFHADGLDAETYHDLMDRGFRRDGDVFYAPDCPACRRCLPLRVDVTEFRPNRSQLRALRRNQDLAIRAGRPEFSSVKLDLFRRYLRGRHPGSGGDISEDAFRSAYYAPVVETVELTYFLGDRLVSVSLLDVSSRSVSAVYHYFDPDLRDRRLGVFSIVAEVAWTRSLGIRHYYLGFWVAGARTMHYKADYRPHELLVDGAWQLAGAPRRIG